MKEHLTAAGTAGDALVIAAGGGATVWNFILSGNLNTVLATIGGLLTIVLLVQRIVRNCRKRRNKKG